VPALPSRCGQRRHPVVALVPRLPAIAAASGPRGDSRRLPAFKRVLGITRGPTRGAPHRALQTGIETEEALSPALYEPDTAHEPCLRAYARQLGMTPATYARGGAGVGIAYVTVPTSWALARCGDERGVCRVALGDTTQPRSRVDAEFPRRSVRGQGWQAPGWSRQFSAYLDVVNRISTGARHFGRPPSCGGVAGAPTDFRSARHAPTPKSRGDRTVEGDESSGAGVRHEPARS